MTVDLQMKALPHGRVPFESVRDAGVKKVVMCLNENIVSLHSQLAATQRAVLALQRAVQALMSQAATEETTQTETE